MRRGVDAGHDFLPNCGEHDCWVTVGAVFHKSGELILELDDTGKSYCCYDDEEPVIENDIVTERGDRDPPPGQWHSVNSYMA